MNRRYRLALAACSLMVSLGCQLGPDYRQPKIELPRSWPKEAATTPAELKRWEDLRDWWALFDDPSLAYLIGRALKDNLDIRLQLARIRETHARLGLAKANRLPTLDLQAEASRERYPDIYSNRNAGILEGGDSLRGGGGAVTSNLFSISGVLGYEVDLWGRLARQQESAEALLAQSVFARDALRLTISADVATGYFNVLSAQEELTILKRTLLTRRQTLEFERNRYEAGAIDALALSQVKAELESVRARIPAQQERVALLKTALAVLIGVEPDELFSRLDFGKRRLASLSLEAGTPRFLPSELLLRRPDVRAAEATLAATTADIGVSLAERLPRLDLASFIGSTASATGDMFTDPSKSWGITASVFGPIIDFGRNKARVETSKALRDQAEARLRITVQTAFREVRDALVVYTTSRDRYEAIKRQTKALRDTLKLSKVRYQEGSALLLEVLDAQRALLDAELGLTQAKRDTLNAVATLFKAMGGGWEAPHVNGLG
jgi:multidrug efflux system outer membrane protein